MRGNNISCRSLVYIFVSVQSRHTAAVAVLSTQPFIGPSLTPQARLFPSLRCLPAVFFALVKTSCCPFLRSPSSLSVKQQYRKRLKDSQAKLEIAALRETDEFIAKSDLECTISCSLKTERFFRWEPWKLELEF